MKGQSKKLKLGFGVNMKKELIKESNKKWIPKYKWIESVTINLETGKKKYKYFIPKTSQEEKRLKAEFDKKMQETFEIIFQNEI